MKHWIKLKKSEKEERVKEGIRVMREVKDKGKILQMSTWGYKSPDAVCGTVACMGGWFGMDPYFRRRGLKLMFYGDDHARLSEPTSVIFGDEYQHIFYDFRISNAKDAIRKLEKILKQVQMSS